MGPGTSYLLVYKPIVLDFLILDLNLYQTRRGGHSLPYKILLLNPGQAGVPSQGKLEMNDPVASAAQAFHTVTGINFADTETRLSLLCLGPLAQALPEPNEEAEGLVHYVYQAVADVDIVAQAVNKNIADETGPRRPDDNDVHEARVLTARAAFDAFGPVSFEADGWRRDQYSDLTPQEQQQVDAYNKKYLGLNFKRQVSTLIDTVY